MRFIKYIFVLLILAGGASFALLNAERVRVNLYTGIYSMPLSLLILTTLVIGILVGFIVGFSMYLRERHSNYKLKKQVKAVSKEIENLRTIPIKDIDE
jgi:lipopolysaccharide assembly protein A